MDDRRIRSVRTAGFRKQLEALPAEIQEQARRAYQLFLQNPFHPSFHRRIIEVTRDWDFPHWEFRVTRAYRATCFLDGNTCVWVFIGHHRDFDRIYR